MRWCLWELEKCSKTMDKTEILKRRISVLLWFFMLALILSGITAFPIKTEIEILRRVMGEDSAMVSVWPGMAHWISFVYRGVVVTSAAYPFLFYGTDWLAFAHLVIALAFIGPLRDPVKNIWVIEFGMIACALVVPLALICGPIRGIPFFWRLIDCSFGVFGIMPLWLTRRYVLQIIELQKGASE